MKARDLDKKSNEKYKVNANYFCQQLGKYRMPFAWTAINVLDILAGNQVCVEVVGGSAVDCVCVCVCSRELGQEGHQRCVSQV